jgi:hypothetical protein
MTEKKHIASTLKGILEHPVAIDVMDRSRPIAGAIDEVQSWWGYDLYNRKPSAAYIQDGVFKTTDLDLACFLYALLGRKAVINIPTYRSRTRTTVREDQKVTSDRNRHGEIIGLTANKEFFSFSIRIKDLNVVGEDQVGYARNFMLTDYDGSWYDGWKVIEFVPTLKENRFITENELWTGNRIYFQNFVSPNRWVSLFGHHYVLTKMMIDRLTEEAKYLRKQMKEMIEDGITYPEGKGPVTAEEGTYSYGESRPVKFTTFEVLLQYPDLVGEYPELDHTQENLVSCYEQQKQYSAIISKLKFMTRATELAHSQSPDRFPAWIRHARWEDGYKLSPRARNLYQRLILFQPKVGEKGFALCRRWAEKTKQVAA